MSISEGVSKSEKEICIALPIANSRRGSFVGFGVLGFVGLWLGVRVVMSLRSSWGAGTAGTARTIGTVGR